MTPPDSIIEGLRTYIATYGGLGANLPLWVNYLAALPQGYSIVPVPGSKIVEEYLDGGLLCEYNFAFQASDFTADDAQRIEIMAFYEAFSDWLRSQTLAGTLPTLPDKHKATAIEAIDSGFLFQEGESQTGVYQLQAKLTYEQRP